MNFFFTEGTLKCIYLAKTVVRMYSQTFFGVHIYLFIFGGAKSLLLCVFSLAVVPGLLFVGASLIAEQGLLGVRTS